MTIILFLVDTSASMGQRTYLGTTILDIAKGAVDTFLKLRQKDPLRSQDRYMLLSFDDPPKNIKAGWKENQATFAQELKGLQSYGLTTFSSSLASAFHLLNVNRLQTGIDTFGYGRCPYYLEPVMLIAITDGLSLTTPAGLQTEIEFRMPPCLGAELCAEPFRWDQRLFTLVLRIPGQYSESLTGSQGSLIPSDVSSINSMCEVTGGRSYCINNQRMLNQCLESLVQKVQHGTVLFFERFGPEPPPLIPDEPSKNNSVENGYIHDSVRKLEPKGLNHVLQVQASNSRPASPAVKVGGVGSADWATVRRMIYVPRSPRGVTVPGHWPLPEEYLVDPQSGTLPPRKAHPTVRFTCDDCEPMIIENLPFDKYELEPSPLTQKILERKQPTSCWQVSIPNSSKYGENSPPFGYLKASTNLTAVNLFVMPYNYPKLLPLLKELVQTHKSKATKEWHSSFDKYLKSIPPYYMQPLRKALQRMGLAHVMPDSLESPLSYSVVAYLKRVKQEAKTEYERLCQSVIHKIPPTDHVRLVPRFVASLSTLVQKTAPNLGESISRTKLGLSGEDSSAVLRKGLNDYSGLMLHVTPGPTKKGGSAPSFNSAQLSARFRNPFDVPRSQLLEQLVKMRTNLSQHLNDSLTILCGGYAGSKLKLQNAEELHYVPIGQMGNYQEYQKRAPLAPPLRDIEPTPVRQHAFGNPFKVDKRMLVDEADVDLVGGGGSSNSGNNSSSTGGGRSPKSPRPASPARPGTPLSPSSPLLKRKAGPLPRDFKWKRRKPGEPPRLSPIAEPASPSIEPITDDDSTASTSGDDDYRNDDDLQIVEDFDDNSSSSSLASGREISSGESHVIDLISEFTPLNTKSLPNGDDPDALSIDIGEDEEEGSVSQNEDDEQPPDDELLPMPSPAELVSLKRRISTLVRKPGRDCSELCQLMSTLPSGIRPTVAQYASAEARRFKRDSLEQRLAHFSSPDRTNSSPDLLEKKRRKLDYDIS